MKHGSNARRRTAAYQIAYRPRPDLRRDDADERHAGPTMGL